MKKLFDINQHDTKKSVSMMMDTLDTLEFFVPAPIFKPFRHSLLGVYQILDDLLDSPDHLRQQFMSDFIGDALRPFTAWDCDLFEKGELEALEGDITDEITDYMQYVQTFNEAFDDMDVRVANYDENTKMSDTIFAQHWVKWKAQPNITIDNCDNFLEDQVRIVFRYNVRKKRLVNGFSCSSSGKFQYDNLERNPDRAVYTPVHEKAHNSQRSKDIKDLPKSLLVEQVLLLSPVKRNPILGPAFSKKIQKACDQLDSNPSIFTKKNKSFASIVSGPSAPSTLAKERKSIYVTDWLSQVVGPTKHVNPLKISADPSDLKGTLQPVHVNGHGFMPARREALAEGGVLHAYLYLGGALPKIPNPFCYDPDEVNERKGILEG